MIGSEVKMREKVGSQNGLADISNNKRKWKSTITNTDILVCNKIFLNHWQLVAAMHLGRQHVVAVSVELLAMRHHHR